MSRRRPLPTLPRGSARAAAPSDRAADAPPIVRLRCPRICPQWQLASMLALVKPKPYTRSAVGHRSPRQPWPRNGRRIVEDFLENLPGSLLGAVEAQYPRGGDDYLVFEIVTRSPGAARRFARALSHRLPDLWLQFDEAMFLRDGVFYQRTGKYKLELVRTKRIRLRRSIRFGFYGDLNHAIAPARNRTGENDPPQ